MYLVKIQDSSDYIWPCCIVLGYDVVLEDRGREGDGEREGGREGGSEGRRE